MTTISLSLYRVLAQLVAHCMKVHYINRPSIESVTATLATLHNTDNFNNSGTLGRDNLVSITSELNFDVELSLQLEAYAKNLEESLEEKTECLENLEAALAGL